MTRLVERALRDSRAVDAEALCVVAGRKVPLWFLHDGRREKALQFGEFKSCKKSRKGSRLDLGPWT